MNYRIVNKSVMNKSDVPINEKREKFYKYFLDNNVAYYYSKEVSNKEDFEKRLIKAGENLNKKYLKTLNLIDNICKKEKIEFILFKTHKHIPEVVDGDIDIFVKEKDFKKFLELMRNQDFTCEIDSYLKASCTKSGFSIIEPRVTIFFLGRVILGEKEIWKNTKKIKYENMNLNISTRELDIFFLLLNVLYGPNYFKLYAYLIFKNLNEANIMTLSNKKEILEDLKTLISKLKNPSIVNKRFPFFPSDLFFINWWIRRVLFNSQLPIYPKIKHILFYFYAKYGYIAFGNLPLRHDWGIKNV